MRTYNIKESYVYEDDPWLVILAAAAFYIRSIENELELYGPSQLLFGYDMIILIKHTMDWGLIRQQNQMQIDKNNIS